MCQRVDGSVWRRGYLQEHGAIQADAINGVPTLSTFLFLLRLCAAGEGVQGVVAEISDGAWMNPLASLLL